MMHTDDRFDEMVAASLRTHLLRAVDPDTDLWSRVEARARKVDTRALAKKRILTRRLRHVGVAVVAGVTMVVAALTVPAVASSHLRNQLDQRQIFAGISYSRYGHLDSAAPYAGFQTLDPTYLPPQFTEYLFHYVPNPAGTSVESGMVPLPNSHEQAIANENVPYLYVLHSDVSNTQYVEVLERKMLPTQALSPGTLVPVHGTMGTVHLEGPITVLDFDLGDTHMTLRTTLGEDEAIKIANSM